MQDFRTKANQIAFTNTETLKAGNVQKAIESVESKIPYDEYGGNKLFLNPSMPASEINTKIENMENRGIIIFEEGTYNLEETIYIENKKDLTFVGDGEVLLVGSEYSVLYLEDCENIKIYKVDMSGGFIETYNLDGFSLERCFIDGSLSIEGKNIKVIDCIFTDGIYVDYEVNSLKIENTEIQNGGLHVCLPHFPYSEEAKVYVLNTKIKGESYFSGIKAKFENVIFQDYIQFDGADMQFTSCDFLYEGDEENVLYIFVSKLKMENCFINTKESFIDNMGGIPGGISINNCVFMGGLKTYSEGFNITNSKILGGLIHGGKNSRIEKNIIKSEKEFDWYESSLQLLDDNITVKNNEIENSVGLGFSVSGENCTILNNKISGFSMGVRLTYDSFLFQNNIVNSAQGYAGEFIGDNFTITNNKFESLDGCLITGGNIIFSKNIVTSDNNGVTMDHVVNSVFTGNIIESGGTGMFFTGQNNIISNNKIHSNITGLYSNKAIKCSITNNIVTSIIDNSGSETDPEKGNYYLGNITDSFELLADEGYENIAIVYDFDDIATKGYVDQSLASFGGVPSGGIIMWSGSINNIPVGWALCDGSNGTPDLRDRFIVGAGGSYNAGDTGGANTVTLTEDQIPSHSHSSGTLNTDLSGSHSHTYKRPSGGMSVESADFYDIYRGIEDAYTSSDGSHDHDVTGDTGNTGGGQAHENRPPYYALAYIMKL